MGDIVPTSLFHLRQLEVPEIRKDPLTNRCTIIATERAKRALPPGGKLEVCPFCAGHESETQPEVAAYRPENGIANDPSWRVRVVPNLYPAVRMTTEQILDDNPWMQSQIATGFHEVVIECPQHETNFANISPSLMLDVVHIWCDRLRVYANDSRIRYVQLFKNQGTPSGASLEHLHSQVLALPFIPPLIEDELTHFNQYYTDHSRCLMCDYLAEELNTSKRIILETEHFVALSAYAARWPFEVWIVPRRHEGYLETMSKQEQLSFAEILHSMLRKLSSGLNNPPYNLCFHNGAYPYSKHTRFHWHLEIIPRLTQPAGFEWASFCHLNPVPPEQAAQFLRQ